MRLSSSNPTAEESDVVLSRFRLSLFVGVSGVGGTRPWRVLIRILEVRRSSLLVVLQPQMRKDVKASWTGELRGIEMSLVGWECEVQVYLAGRMGQPVHHARGRTLGRDPW